MISFGTAAGVAVIVLLAATIQRAVGFGFALLAVPLMAIALATWSGGKCNALATPAAAA